VKILLLSIATIAALLGFGDHPAEHELEGPIATTTIQPATVTPYDYSTGVAPHSTAGTSSTATSTLPTPTTSTVSTYEVRCGEWVDLALQAGWPADRIEILLDDIAWDESRCDPTVISPTKDYGLLQINWKTWGGYVESFGLDRNALLVPSINLYLGLQIAEMAVDAGWRWCQPWDMSGARSC